MNKTNTAVLLIFFLSSCVSSRIHNYHFNQKTAAPELREDVVLLKKILEANHPSLYWYTPKDSVDYYFNNAINSINDSLSETAFRNKVSYVISKIHCGHTAVRFSADYNKLLEKNRYPMFPLSIKTWGDSMVVIGSYLPKDSIFKRGTIITSINGKTNREILDSMFQLIGSDGYANTYKSQVVSGSFATMYKMVWGLDSSYTITYLDAFGKNKTGTITNYSPSVTKVKQTKRITDSTKTIVKTIIKDKKTSRKQRRNNTLQNIRSSTIDSTESTAYMRLTTFSEGHLRRFFHQSFKKLEETKTKNLIIDLRENTGGYVSNSNLFTKYIINKAFKNADTAVAITQSIKHPFYVRESLKYWFCAHLVSRKMADGMYHDRRAETHFFKPKTKYHFNGKVYILQGGYTYSASTMFTSTVKGQSNVTSVGEESGGGNYGNTAMYMPTIILPNSKLRVIMPTFRMVMDVNRKKDGRGVMPDVYVSPSSDAIRKGIDYKLEEAKKLIVRARYEL